MFNDSNFSNMATSSANKRLISSLRDRTFESGDRLASGHRDISAIVRGGEVDDLYAIDRELLNISQYLHGVNQADLRLSAVQDTLEQLRTSASRVSLGVLSSLNEKPANSYLAEARNASGALDAIVSSLNQSVAGEALFSGASLNSSALVGASQIVDDVEAILRVATDVVSAQSAVDFYFNDPSGGFALSSYIGSTSDGPSIEVLHNQYIAQDIRADHPAIRETIQNLAVMAAISNGAVYSTSDQRKLLKHVAETNLNTNETVVFVQQGVGQKQELLEQASTSNHANKASIEGARNKVTSVDIFAEAARFEELQVQLETSYNVLVRLSSLNLSSFLR